jgi:hypothetical protein
LQFEASPDKEFMEPYLEKPFTKNRTGGVVQSVDPEFKPQYSKKKVHILLVLISLVVYLQKYMHKCVIGYNCSSRTPVQFKDSGALCRCLD